VTERSDGPPDVEFLGLPAGARWLRLEIPPNVNRLRADSPELAALWGVAVRRAFQESFAAGYRAVGFGESSYLLEHVG
jgi:predicted GNAT superfamily acetyltransferase